MKRFMGIRADAICQGDEVSLDHNRKFRVVEWVSHVDGKVELVLKDGLRYIFRPDRIVVTMREEE
jgi:hypothetical protein